MSNNIVAQAHQDFGRILVPIRAGDGWLQGSQLGRGWFRRRTGSADSGFDAPNRIREIMWSHDRNRLALQTAEQLLDAVRPSRRSPRESTIRGPAGCQRAIASYR